MLRECIKYPTLANALLDIYWSQVASSCFSSMLNCQTSILLLML
uniref:Protein Mo25 n=1 Tax=Arundo donax TaxID=35708 RepID=A0A0A9HEK8_ARUDO